LLAVGQTFRAGWAAVALADAVPSGDPTGRVEVALARLRLMAATGDTGRVVPAATDALRAASAVHLPWARLRVLAVWRDVAVATSAPEAGALRARVRRIGARAPAGWQAAVAERNPPQTRAVVRASTVRARPQEAGGGQIAGLVGESDVVRLLRRDITRAARTAFPVLIEGETGAGK
jgi:transcriptional regulator of acetoin/glycerol metabolism